jgi:hypothetical protein
VKKSESENRQDPKKGRASTPLKSGEGSGEETPLTLSNNRPSRIDRERRSFLKRPMIGGIAVTGGYVLFEAAPWLNYERLALKMTSLNIKSAFLNQPIETAGLREQFQGAIGLGTALPQLLVRFGYAAPMPRSLRHPVERVLLFSRQILSVQYVEAEN